MTSSDATTPKRRTPSGAAIPGGAPRPTLYPRQLVIMADDELVEAVEAIAAADGVSKSETMRRLMHAGIDQRNERD